VVTRRLEIGLPIVGEGEAEVATGRERVRLALGVVQVEDRTAGSYVMVRPKGATPLIGVVALEQMGFRVDPMTGRLVKGLPLMPICAQGPEPQRVAVVVGLRVCERHESGIAAWRKGSDGFKRSLRRAAWTEGP